MRQSVILGVIALLIGLALIPVAIIVPRFVNRGASQMQPNLSETQLLILQHPTNAPMFAAWCSGSPHVTDVIEDSLALGTHPDLLDYFYATGRANAPDDVNVVWVVCGRPGLVNPDTGIVYGLATGTNSFFFVCQMAAATKPINMALAGVQLIPGVMKLGSNAGRLTNSAQHDAPPLICQEGALYPKSQLTKASSIGWPSQADGLSRSRTRAMVGGLSSSVTGDAIW